MTFMLNGKKLDISFKGKICKYVVVQLI